MEVGEEVWKVLQPYQYEVSNHGRIRNPKGYILKAWDCPTRNGVYPKVGLWRWNRRKVAFLHRLVALAFIPNPEGKPEVNHFDTNPFNNHVSNLQWATRREQEAHKRFMEDTK